MVREYFQTEFILNDSVKRMAPWHSKLGGPGFPKKYLWESADFNPIEVTTIKEIGKGKGIKKIIGKRELVEMSIDFEAPLNNSGSIIFKNNGSEEARITEIFDYNNKEVSMIFHSEQDKNADLSIKARVLSDSQAELSFGFNGKEFNEKFTLGQRTIPSALIDLIDEIDKYNPQITVGALNHDMIVGLYSEAFNHHESQPPTITVDWNGLYCVILVILCDVIHWIASILGAIYNFVFIV